MSDFVAFVAPEPGAGPATHQSRLETNPIARDRLPDGELPFTFKDFLDTINPLQQIPIVNVIYRAITGDQPSLAPRLIGAAIFGGALGVLLAGVQACIDDMTGTAKQGGLAVAALRGVFGGSDDVQGSAQANAGAAATPKVDVRVELAPPAAAATAAVPAAETFADIAPAASAAAGVSPAATAVPPRAAPVSVPRGWSGAFNTRGSMAAPVAYSRDVTTPREAAPAAAQAGAMRRDQPVAATHPYAPPVDLPADWMPSTMLRALDKYESTRRLSRDDTPKVSTVE
jgi:hypothetical protein